MHTKFGNNELSKFKAFNEKSALKLNIYLSSENKDKTRFKRVFSFPQLGTRVETA